MSVSQRASQQAVFLPGSCLKSLPSLPSVEDYDLHMNHINLFLCMLRFLSILSQGQKGSKEMPPLVPQLAHITLTGALSGHQQIRPLILRECEPAHQCAIVEMSTQTFISMSVLVSLLLL